MNLDWMDGAIREAVKHFWLVRDGGVGVRAGKTLDPFVDIITKTVTESGLPNAKAYTGRNSSQLPGFFRPHKSWDVVVINDGKLIAAVEFKSQVGSIGNNFNNRTEEVLGSALDLQTAIEEDAFEDATSIFTGYLIVVEKSASTLKTPNINMDYFPVMKGFLHDEGQRDYAYKKDTSGKFTRVKGISYLSRYDLMCRRLVAKKLYTATAVVAVPNENHDAGHFENLSAETSIKTFLTRLSAHCEVVAEIDRQKAQQ